MTAPDDEDELLRSVALQNATSILLARQRAEAELLRTKEALRESQERLQAALGAAGTGTFRWDIATNTVEWDGNLGRLFGLEPGRTTASLGRFFGAVHADDRPAVIARFEQSARDGSDVDTEFRVVWPDGSVHWISDKAKVFFDEEGSPLYVTGACADVTSRNVAAETLRASEERLRAMFNQAAVAIAVADLDGRVLDVNQKFSDLLGYGEDEIRKLTFQELTHADDLAETEAGLGRLLAGEVRESALEKRYVRKGGTVVWSLTTLSLLKDADGRPRRFLAIIDDITARKLAEAALQEETRILELLHQTGRALASELDLQAVVQAVTDAGTELSGARFGAFFYNTTGESGDAFLLYTLAGAPREAFEKFAQPRATALFGPTFRGEAPIPCDDVLADPRYGQMAPHYGNAEGPPARAQLSRRACAIALRSDDWWTLLRASRTRGLHRTGRAAHGGPGRAGGYRDRQRAALRSSPEGSRGAEGLGSLGWSHFGRSGTAAAGHLEPPLECHQVHAQRRQGAGPARARELPRGDQRGRYRNRRSSGVHPVSVRSLPPGRRLDDPQLRRSRSWTLHRQEHRGAARRVRAGGEPRRRPGHDGHGEPANHGGIPAAGCR